MSDSIQNKKTPSPLVQAVLALDEYFSELERIGAKIGDMDLKSDFDFEHVQRLLKRFAECGQGISLEVTELSTHLNVLRARAEEVAQSVSARADQVGQRKQDEQKKFEEFRELGERVRALSTILNQAPEDERKSALAAVEEQLNPLIERAQNLRQDAHNSKMRSLEQNADSLAQTLVAIRQKVGASVSHYAPKM